MVGVGAKKMARTCVCGFRDGWNSPAKGVCVECAWLTRVVGV